MEIQFSGKIALVTGAGKGIGRDTAKMLVKLGAKTYALSRTQSDLDSLKAEVPEMNTVTCDLADWDATQKAVEYIGPIDLLVNNACIVKEVPFLEITKDDFDIQMAVNLRAYMQVAQIAARTMVARGSGGSIVNISSDSSQLAFKNFSSYGFTKAGVEMLTKSMAMELGSHNIRTNSVNPTFVLTSLGKEIIKENPTMLEKMLERIPAGRFVEVEEVVNVVMFLLSDKSQMVNGAMVPVEGGLLVAGV